LWTIREGKALTKTRGREKRKGKMDSKKRGKRARGGEKEEKVCFIGVFLTGCGRPWL